MINKIATRAKFEGVALTASITPSLTSEYEMRPHRESNVRVEAGHISDGRSKKAIVGIPNDELD